MNVRLDTRLRAGARRCGVMLICLFLALVSIALPSTAAAEADAGRDSSARELFEQGVTLAERGDWAAAEDRFRRALSLRNSSVIAYNLASALSEQGKLIEASELLHRMLQDDKTEHGLRQTAIQLQSGIAPRIGRIEVTVESKGADDSVLLDGRMLLPAQLGVDIPVDPGSHQLRLERGGQTIDLKTIKLDPGGRQEARLIAPPLTAAPEVAASDVSEAAPSLDQRSNRDRLHGAQASSAQHPQRDRGSSVLTRWWFWTGVVAIVGVGTLVGVAAVSGGSHADPTYHGSLGPGTLQVEVAK